MALEDHISSNWKKLQKTVKVKNKVTKKSNQSPKKAELSKTKSIIKKISTNSIKKERQNTVQLLRALKKANKESQDSKKLGHLATDAELNKGLSMNQKQIGKYLAIDCEFVGIGPEGTSSALARVSIVNFHGHTVYDKFVQPREKVTDWRTWVSGVTPESMKDAIDFKTAQTEVGELLQGRILIGHAVHHDLEALWLSHPKILIRDTSKHKPFRELSKGKTPGLKKLAKEVLKIDIQGGQHSSVEDARATMMLYKLHKKEFEKPFHNLKSRE